MSRTEHIERLPMPMVYVQHLAREFPDLDRLLDGTSLDRADLDCASRTISVRDDLRCVANAVAMAGSPAWYHKWGLRMAEHYHGALTNAWLFAPTLGHGMEAFRRYFPSRIPYMEIDCHRTPSDFVIELRPLIDVGGILALLIEVPFLIVQQYVETMRNGPMTQARIELAYPAPSYADAYGEAFVCPIAFGCDANRLLLPLEWLDVRNLAHDESAWRAALNECEVLRSGRASPDTINSVRNALFAALDRSGEDDPMPTLKSIAAAMHVSPRTLIRRLQAVGTSFSSEVDDVRRMRAQAMIESGVPIAQIAATLKYGDATGFGKAFRRWFGVSPRQYQASMRRPD